jgi:hypothetical protein
MKHQSGETPFAFEEYRERPWDIPGEAPVVVRSDASFPVRVVRRKARVLVAAGALAVSCLAWFLWPMAGTLGTTEVGPWDMKMTSGGSQSVVALVYGKEAGLHLLRVPSSKGTAPALLSSRVGNSPLYMISLGRAPLAVEAVAPPGLPIKKWSARGRVIQAFKDERGTGVRAW